MERIGELRAILADRKLLLGVIKEEILVISGNTAMTEELPLVLMS